MFISVFKIKLLYAPSQVLNLVKKTRNCASVLVLKYNCSFTPIFSLYIFMTIQIILATIQIIFTKFKFKSFICVSATSSEVKARGSLGKEALRFQFTAVIHTSLGASSQQPAASHLQEHHDRIHSHAVNPP